MSKVLITKSKLDILATSISAKSGEALPMTLAEMKTAVDGIETGGITPTGTITITQNGQTDVTQYATADVQVPSSSPTLQTKSVSYTPTESAQSETVTADSGYDGLSQVSVSVGAVSSTYVGTGITRRSSSDLTASGATVTVPSGYYSTQSSKSVSTGTEGTPTATKGTVSNHAVTVTPSVTNSAGYISGGTHTGTGVSVSASELVSGTYTVDSAGTKDVTQYASASIPSGTAGTPSATKGTVSNHAVTVTPSVTNATGWITGGTKTGTAVTVSASELASGNKAITENGTNIDVVGYSTVSVNVSGSGANIDTKTVTASNYPTSISFTGMEGRPLAFFLRSTSQISSSGSTTYYYIIDMRYNGTNTTGNCFRIGSTRRVDTIASGYSWSYSGTTLTITSSASSRSSSPGAFNNGYELVYVY